MIAIIYQICPICYQGGTAKTCDCDVSTMMLIDRRLLCVAQGLMDKGFRVARCKVYEVASLKILEVEANFKEVYMESLFTELPSGWQVHQYSYASWGADDIAYTALTNLLPWGTTLDNRYSVDLAICELENWLETLDSDGTKAVLILAGYDVGQC